MEEIVEAIKQHEADTMANEDQRNVFVIHGRDTKLRDSLFEFLRAIGLRPLEWPQALAATKKGAPFIGQILDAAFGSAQAVVALLSGDDEARLRKELQATGDPPYESQLTPQARPNVLFEAGMALAVHPDNTILVQVGSVRFFSDIAGRHILHLNNTIEARQNLASRLKTAGCPVELTGTDWHRAGDFGAATAGKPSAEAEPTPLTPAHIDVLRFLATIEDTHKPECAPRLRRTGTLRLSSRRQTSPRRACIQEVRESRPQLGSRRRLLLPGQAGSVISHQQQPALSRANPSL